MPDISPLAPPDPATVTESRLIMVATWTAAASGVHFVMTWAHYSEGLQVSAFFLVAGLVQATQAGLLLSRPTTRLLVALAAVHLGLVAVWAASRTVGVLAPPEPVGSWDTITVLWELAAVVLAMRLLVADLRPPTLHLDRWTAPAQVSLVITLMLLVLLITDGH